VFLVLSGAILNARADCVDDAATYHNVDPWILRAIAYVESGNRADAIHKNKNGTLDVGIAQINQVHFAVLSTYGISATDLLDPCTSFYTAAWLLKDKMRVHGATWLAVGAYHSENPVERDKYSARVRSVFDLWQTAGLTQSSQ